MEPLEHAECLAWAICCAVGAIEGLSAVPLALLLPAEATRPLPRPLLAVVALGLALSAASIPARLVADIPADRHPARYMESLERRMARLSGEEPPAA